MQKILFLCFALACCCQATQCLAQQALFDVGGEDPYPIGSAVAGGDGTFAVIGSANVATVVKLSSEGVVEWRRSLVPTTPNEDGLFAISSIVEAPGGTVLLGSLAIVETTTTPGGVPDTSWVTQRFLGVDEVGERSAFWRLEQEVVNNSELQLSLETAYVVGIPTGGCYVQWNFQGIAQTSELIRMDDQGNVLWAKSVGDAPPSWWSWNEEVPTTSEFSGLLAKAGLMYTSDGGVLAANSANMEACISARHISSNGALTWSKDYCLEGGQNARIIHSVGGQDGSMYLLVQYGAAGDLAMVMSIDPTGALLSARRVYIDAGILPSCKLIGQEDGELWILVQGSNTLIRAEQGGTGEWLYYSPVAQSPYSFSPYITSADINDGQLRIMSAWEREHSALGTVVEYPALWKMTTMDFSGCGNSSSAFSHVEIPLENFTITDDVDDLVVDITPYFNVSNTPDHELEAVDFLTFDPCAFDVGHEELPAVEGRALARTVLDQGEALVVSGRHGQSIRVLDATGRLVHEHRQSGQVMELPTSGFAPGVYTVLSTTPNGSPTPCERFVIR